MPKEVKNKKENKHFFKDFKAELKKVIWPTPKQLVNNTIAVITIVLITAVIVFVLDFAFEKMNTYGINKIKEAVETKNETTNEVAEDETTSEEEEASNEGENSETETSEENQETPAEGNAEENQSSEAAE